MTPEALTALAALLLETRDWLYDDDPGSLDGDVLNWAVDVLARVRRRLVEDGAR